MKKICNLPDGEVKNVFIIEMDFELIGGKEYTDEILIKTFPEYFDDLDVSIEVE